MSSSKLIVAVLCLASAHSAAAAISRDNVENNTVAPLGEDSASAPRVVVYSVGPLNIAGGAVVDIRFQSEVTTQCSGNIGVGRYVVRASSATATTGTNVVPPAVENVTEDIHHQILVHTGLEQPSSALTGVYYNAIVYALSASSQGCYTESISVPPEDSDSDKLLIEGAGTNSFGELIVEVR